MEHPCLFCTRTHLRESQTSFPGSHMLSPPGGGKMRDPENKVGEGPLTAIRIQNQSIRIRINLNVYLSLLVYIGSEKPQWGVANYV